MNHYSVVVSRSYLKRLVVLYGYNTEQSDRHIQREIETIVSDSVDKNVLSLTFTKYESGAKVSQCNSMDVPENPWTFYIANN